VCRGVGAKYSLVSTRWSLHSTYIKIIISIIYLTQRRGSPSPVRQIEQNNIIYYSTQSENAVFNNFSFTIRFVTMIYILQNGRFFENGVAVDEGKDATRIFSVSGEKKGRCQN